MNNYSEFLELAKSLVIKGGTICKDAQTHVIEYSHKPQEKSHIVTKYDLQIEMLYSQTILAKYPDHSIIGEERGSHQGSSDYQWLIDPIDGTSNFAHGLPIYCTMLSLMHNNNVVCAAVYLPALDELYYSEIGKGAYCNHKRIKIAEKTDLEEAFIFIDRGGKSYDDWYVHFISSNQLRIRGSRILASCGVQMAYVASGKMDGFVSRGTNLYDRAPGVLLVTEAGGTVVGFDGNPYTNKELDIVASNKNLAQEIVRKLSLIP